MFGLRHQGGLRKRLAALLVSLPAVFASPSAANAPVDSAAGQRAQAFERVILTPPITIVKTSSAALQKQDAEPIRVMKPIAVPMPRPRPAQYPMPRPKPQTLAAPAPAQFKPAAKAVAAPVKVVAMAPVKAPAVMPPSVPKVPATAQSKPGGGHGANKSTADKKSFIERVTLVYDGLTWHLLKREDTAHGTKSTTRLVTCGGKYAKNLKGGHYNCSPNGVGVKVDVSDITGIDGTYVGVYGFDNSFGKPVRAVIVGKKWDVLDGKMTLALSVGYDFAHGYKSPIIAAPQIDFNLDKITGRRELEGWSITAKVSPLGITRDSRSSMAGMIGIQYKFSNNWLKPTL